jgi:hypothetical protein
MSIAGLRNLCVPAVIYLAISMLLLVVMYIQNRNNVDVYCLGAYECDVTNVTAIFLVKFVYILFWTWILNLICKSGWTSIAWLLLLLPIIMFFLLIALLFIS